MEINFFQVMSIPNRHGAGCGKAPNITCKDDTYYAYFMNAYGEQNIFVANKGSRKFDE